MDELINLLEFSDNIEKFYKIGKTNQNISRRFRNNKHEYKIKEICIIESTHLLVAEEENNIINKYYDKYGYIPFQKFVGYTECFKPEIIGELC